MCSIKNENSYGIKTRGIFYAKNEKEVRGMGNCPVRLTVFMKGCSLHCEWCHNPEACPQNRSFCIKGEMRGLWALQKICEHEECRPFGRCLHICPNDCLTLCGEEYMPESLAKKITAYKPIFDACGGGVTFSGGEPLMQWEFLFQTIDKLDGIHTAIETSGFASERVFRDMLDKIDFVYMDIKLFDGELHKKYTGLDNDTIKNNFRILQASGKPYCIRTPLIKGKTDTEENLRAIKEFIEKSPWEKLSENPLAKSKYLLCCQNK